MPLLSGVSGFIELSAVTLSRVQQRCFPIILLLSTKILSFFDSSFELATVAFIEKEEGVFNDRVLRDGAHPAIVLLKVRTIV